MTDTTIAPADQVFNYTIQSKPTVYEGRLFRSNLEATWAAFFDNMGWKWDYEPIVLDGWTPDFYLQWGGSGNWCEVKPVTRGVHLPTCEKMIRARPSGSLMFLGVGVEARLIAPGDLRWRIGWEWNVDTCQWSEFHASLGSTGRDPNPQGCWNAAAATTKIKGRYW